jgi:exonuclease III
MSLNIAGLTSKIENTDLIIFFNTFDIVCLNETKTIFPVNIPGFHSIRSQPIDTERRRGGVLVLFKHHLVKHIHEVEIETDQVWFKLKCNPDLIFGACYIPPSDSPFFSKHALSSIQEKCKTSGKVAIILGDLNARLGQLHDFSVPGITYDTNPDNTINSNGRDIRLLCKDLSLVPINHSKTTRTHSEGGLTFKKKTSWISQLDWGLCSNQYIDKVKNFKIHYNESIPSDHAAISVTITSNYSTPDSLLERASLLGTYPEQGTG